MYPAEYCSGDSHEYPGYVCSVCGPTNAADDLSYMGDPQDLDAIARKGYNEVVSDSWAAPKSRLTIDDEVSYAVRVRQLELDFDKDSNLTFLVEVDGWPTRYYSLRSKQYMWEAPCRLAYPEAVVRIPAEYFVKTTSDGASYTMEVIRDDGFLSHTRQSYVRAASTK
jgi:hypothetical protein